MTVTKATMKERKATVEMRIELSFLLGRVKSMREGVSDASKNRERFGIIVDQMESILEKHADATYDARQIMVKG
jgi:hypothetical protein